MFRLNNRKARLARAAKDVRVPYDGEGLDRAGGSGHLDSPRSSMDDARVSLGARGSIGDEAATDIAVAATVDEDVGTSSRAVPTASSMSFEEGQYVMLVDERGGEDVGKGEVFQVDGRIW